MLLYRITQLKNNMINRKKLLFEGNDEGQEWVVVYYKGFTDLVDDNFESDDTVEVSLTAPDFNTAVKYAQQYLRKMQTDEETASSWEHAEILSVELY